MPASKPIEGALRPRPVIGFVVSALFLLAICGAHQPAVHPYTDQPGRLEENRPCYWTLTSLVKEVHGEVVRGPGIVEAEDLSPHDESLRFPYSNQYCQLHRDRHLHVVPVGCSLQDFNPEKFLELIRGRRLVMWGDSVTRQFFMYLSIRLRGHTESTAKVFKETHLPSVGGNCKMHSLPNMDGVRLSRACFDAVAVWEHVCFTYHGNKTALCFVRADTDVVDDTNVGFFNDLRSDDVMLVNVGIHCNKRECLAKKMQEFARLLRYQVSEGRRLPLVVWRDTSPQHFRGGDGGNFPLDRHAELRQVDPARFRCSFYSHEDMRRSDWRNQVLNTVGLEEFQAFNLTVPVLRVWNASSLLPGKHPQTLGHSSVADCTHWCPTMGGIFEIWSQLFFNLFAAVKRHEGVLRAPVLVDRNWAYPADSAIQRHQPAASSLDHLWNALAKWSQTSDEI